MKTARGSLLLLAVSGLCLAQVPTISGISPTSAIAGSPSFTLAVFGQNFAAVSQVLWNGGPLPNCFYDPKANTLTCQVAAALVATPGTVAIQVVNVYAAGAPQSSNIVVFTIIAAPSIGALSPSSITAGCTGVVITILGTGFLPGAQQGSLVQWSGPGASGQVLTPTFITSTELRVGIPDSLLAQAGTASVWVLNVGGIPSNVLDFVISPAPLIQTLNPSSAAAGGAQFTLTLTGSNFVQGSTVQWLSPSGSTTDLAITFLAGTQLRATVPANLMTAAGTARVSVVSPPCGIRSNLVSFVIVPALAITTTSLPNGTVGVSYAAVLAATGGTQPYSWSVSGNFPAGLTLNGNTGAIGGAPTAAGAFTFTIGVRDGAQNTASRAFTITIVAGLTITTASPLPNGTNLAPYSQTLAASGGATPYTWAIVSGALPAGLSLNVSTGVITGTPTAPGRSEFTAQVTDGARSTATKAFTLTINPAALAIATVSPLPGGTVGVSYSQKLIAFGGVQPYTWTVSAGSLPPGLSLLGGTGDITGTPTAAGTYSFNAQVTDSARSAAAKPFTLTVTGLPGLAFSGISDVVQPTQQPTLQVNLASAAPVTLSGRLTLSFAPDVVVSTQNLQLQVAFATGGQTADLTIPAGSTRAQFGSAQDVGVQVGTVAGTITVTASLRVGQVDVTPSPAPRVESRINRAAPVISSARVTRTTAGFEVEIIGYATPRQVTGATFRFTASGADLTTPEIVVNVDNAFTTWYQNTASASLGSQFRYVQPFTVTGEATALSAVRVTLTNASGVSQERTASF